MRKLKHREVMRFAHDHTAGIWQSWTLPQIYLTSDSSLYSRHFLLDSLIVPFYFPREGQKLTQDLIALSTYRDGFRTVLPNILATSHM